MKCFTKKKPFKLLVSSIPRATATMYFFVLEINYNIFSGRKLLISIYYPSNLFRKARGFENWGIFMN